MSDESKRLGTQEFAGLVLAGVLVRLGFLWWVSPVDLWADEGQYLYQALAWNRFGFYLGSLNWVWPPGYPAFVAPFLAAFGEQGVLAAKLAQVLLAGVVGASVVLLAQRLFTPRAARLAGLLWAGYLPLIVYTHTLWPEIPFAALLGPAVVLYLSALEGAPRPALRMALAGACLGGACLLKEAVLPLLVFLPALAILAFGRRGAAELRERAGLAGVLLLAAAAVVLPWTLRNHEVYGRWVPSGATVGENVYQGLNADYLNYDYAGARALDRVDPESWTYRWLVRWPEEAEKWERSEAPNTIDKDEENAERGKAFARAYPGYYLRSRVKKLADWVTPLNFFQRHLRLGLYDGSIESPWARRPLVLASCGLTALVLACSVPGLFLAVRRARWRWTMLALVATFLAGIFVVSMSRYRAPAEPFLIVLAAGLLAGAPWRASRSARVLACAGVALLVGLWLVNAGEVAGMLRESLR